MHPFTHHFPHLPPVGPIIGQIQAILQHGGYWLIGAASILESIPLLGTIIPGHTIVILGGFFAKLGFLNIYAVAGIAAGGSILGDLVGYFLGKRYGLSLITRWGKYFLIKQESLDKARELINRHTGKALIIGRFNPVARCFTPFLVGAGGGKWKTFWIYDIIAGISWAVISVAIGYVFGASYHLIASFIGEFTTIGIIIAILIALGYYFINSRRHLFSRHDFYLLFASLFALIIFFKSVEDIFSRRPIFVNLDVAVNMAMARHVVPFLVSLAEIISNVFSPITLSVAAAVLLVWFLFKKRRHYANVMIAAFPIGLFFDYILKIAIQRPRPVNMLVHETDFSFPSGHAVASAIFATLLIYYFARHIKNRHWRDFFIVANVCVVAIICASRVYLNVHWFSDVVAGASFGIFWATLSILIVRYVEGLSQGRGAKEIKIEHKKGESAVEEHEKI
jgi:undecaprenyl-diphosphatase